MSLREFLSPFFLYGFAGVIIVAMGLYALAVQAHVLRKILASNAMGSGVFLIYGSLASRNSLNGVSDPLPQAVVITGIVVAVSSTALAIAIARRIHLQTGQKTLDSEERGS